MARLVLRCTIYSESRLPFAAIWPEKALHFKSMRFELPEIWTLAAIFTIAGLILAFGHVAEEVFEGDATKFDQTILLFFRSASDVSDPIGPPWTEEMARDITALGSYAVLTILLFAVVIYLFMARQRAAALWVAAAVSGGVVLSNLLKFSFERPRPDLVPHAVRVFTTSFPSGHATLSAITYLTLGALLASLHEAVPFKTLLSWAVDFADGRYRH